MKLLKHTECRDYRFKPDFKRAMILLASVSGVAMLTGCSWLGIKNPFSDQRPDQVVDGQRRTPVYNTVDMQKIAAAQAAAQAQQSPPPPPPGTAPPPTKLDPYDYYSAAAGQSTDNSAHTLGNLNPAPVRADQALAARKPLAENIYNGQNTSFQNNTGASSQTASLQTVPAGVSSYVPPPQPVADEALPKASPPPSSRPSFFSRMFGSSDTQANPDSLPPPWKSRGEFSSESALPESEKNAPFAPLSSVPETPPEFKDIKANRDQDIQNLQNEHAAAQAQKQALENEPSQQQTVTPVEMPVFPAQPAMPVSEPAANMTGAVTAPVPEETPHMPKRGVDIMTQDEWDAMQKAKVQSTTPPAMQQSVPDASMDNAQPPQPQQNLAPVPAAADPVTGSSSPPVSPLLPAAPAGTAPDDKTNGGGSPEPTAPAVSKPLSENQPDSAVREEKVASAPTEPATEVAEHRPSFFARLFTSSHDADGVKDKAPETEAQPDAKAFAEAAPSAGPQDQNAVPPSGGWLRSLISDSQAHPVENVAPLPKAETTSEDASPAVAAPPVIPVASEDAPPATASPSSPVVATSDNHGPAPQLIGEISDKPTPAAPANAATASAIEDASKTAPAATEAAQKSEEDQPRRVSYWSRLFGVKSPSYAAEDTDDAKPEKTDEKPVADSAAPVLPVKTAEETPAAKASEPEHSEGQASPSSPVPAAATEAEHPDFLARLVGSSSPAASEDTAQKDVPKKQPVIENAPQPLAPAPIDNASHNNIAAPETAAAATPSADDHVTSAVPAAAAPEAAAEPERPGFFGRLLGNSSPAVPEDTAQKETPKEQPVVENAPQPSAPARVDAVSHNNAAVPETAPAPDDHTASNAVPAPSAPEAVAEPERPGFFGRLFGSSSPSALEDTAQKDSPKNQAMADSAAQPSSAPPPVALAAPAAAASAADTPAPAAPLLSNPVPANPVAASSAPVSASVANPAPVAPAASGDSASSLPSPELLNQVKMMPVSRYSVRMQNPDNN